MRARRSLVFALVAAAVGCSWSAFDEFKSDTPVYAFASKSFGVLVAISSDTASGTAFLGTGGNTGDGSRYYALGDGKADPSGAPLNSTPQCTLTTDVGTQCLLGNEIVGVGTLVDTAPRKGCFVVGYGKLIADPLDPGPVAYCTDGQIFTLGSILTGDATTKGAAPVLTTAFTNHDEATIRTISISFAAIPGGASNPPLLFGDEADNAAFVYPSIVAGAAPTLLARPSKANRFGHAVAMGTVKGATAFAVGAPVDGTVYVYSGQPSKPAAIVHVGCTDNTGAGADVIAFGDVDGDRNDDLLVAEGSGAGRVVQVYLGSDMPTTKAAGDCGAKWPKSSKLLKCVDTGGVSGCSGDTSFASSIAIGDLDGDGTNEVAVGAPHATAEGNGNSGGVFLYKPAKSNDVLDVRYLGKPESGAAFGSSVAIGKVGTQDTLAASAPGTGKAYVVWCTNLPGAPGGPRCRK